MDLGVEMRGSVGGLIVGLFWCMAALAAANAQNVAWPSLGPDRGYLNLQGYVDTVPNFLGPVSEILVVTLPQPMVVEMLLKGGSIDRLRGCKRRN